MVLLLIIVEQLRATRDRLKREILEEKMMNSLTELAFELDDGMYLILASSTQLNNATPV